jgi:hypothetical protein
MAKFKTKDKVKWLLVRSRGQEPIWKYGKIIGWYAEDAPIIQVDTPDEEGNTAFVYFTSAIHLAGE